ncbi:MAG: hypothetical protein IJ224_10035 [Lachnospiraceae bacterium]|nr:hypothetical protein [Lachnospiraceae bacterium]
MSNSNYFNQALHDMVFENACGAAIKRLADKSFPISYIVKELDYPISFERVQKYVWQYYLDNKTIIYPDNEIDYTEENGIITIKKSGIKKTFIKEQGPYGKTTFRQIVTEDNDVYLNNHTNSPDNKYVVCNFGELKYSNLNEYESMLNNLNKEDRTYIADLPWQNKKIYHILNDRLKSIYNSLRASNKK